MENDHSALLEAFVRGKLDRRGLLQALGFAATAGLTASVASEPLRFRRRRAVGSRRRHSFKAVAYNHILQVSDYAKVRDFYVNLFGMKCVWDDGKQCSVEFGDPPNAIYIRPLTKPLDRPGRRRTQCKLDEQMGKATVDHLAFFD